MDRGEKIKVSDDVRQHIQVEKRGRHAVMLAGRHMSPYTRHEHACTQRQYF